MAQTNYFTFGYKGNMEEIGTENAKEVISDFFSDRSDAKIKEFHGNQSASPGDVMVVEVLTNGGTSHMFDSLNKKFRYHNDFSFIGAGPRLKK